MNKQTKQKVPNILNVPLSLSAFIHQNANIRFVGDFEKKYRKTRDEIQFVIFVFCWFLTSDWCQIANTSFSHIFWHFLIGNEIPLNFQWKSVFFKNFASHCWLVTDSPHSFPIFSFSYSRWPCYVRAPDLLFIFTFLTQIHVHNLRNKYWFSCLTSQVYFSSWPLYVGTAGLLSSSLLQCYHFISDTPTAVSLFSPTVIDP